MALDCEIRAASTMRQDSVTMMRSLGRDAREQKRKVKNKVLVALIERSVGASEQIKTVFHLKVILIIRIARYCMDIHALSFNMKITRNT